MPNKPNRSTKVTPKLSFNNRSYAVDQENGFTEEIFKMNTYTEYKTKTAVLSDWKSLLNLKKTASKWIHLASSRRSKCKSKNKNNYLSTNINTSGDQFYENLNTSFQGIASECEDSSDEEEQISSFKHKTKTSISKLSKSSNKALLIYFSKLARSNNSDDELDLEFIESLIQNGADVNMADKYGQTIFHEVARTWHVDVVKFLLAHNGKINQADRFGRTPLHIAAAVNYPEMVKSLVQNGANSECRTYSEEQTPVHYAAKNDAVDSLQVLLKLDCDIEARDSKNRTPLHVAAELDRSETAMFLVEQNAKVGVVDKSGLSAVSLMIEKMPPVAKKALDQFHKTDRPNRKQYFFLNLLEPVQPGQHNVFAKTPMQTLIRNKQMNLLLHPVFRQLVAVKWQKFARIRQSMQLFTQLFFVLIWSIFGATTPYNTTSEYSGDNLKEKWWRLVLEIIAVVMTLYFIVLELYELRCSAREHKKWKEWRSKEIQKDLTYCHPRWPEERKYILQELDRISNSTETYFDDLWNILDWVTYIWICAGVIARVCALTGDDGANGIYKKLLATSMVPIWLRLMKYIRAFQALGPFIVMLGHILQDTMKFLFLYLEFFVPFIIAFWIIFGGSQHATVMKNAGEASDGWEKINDLIYSVWLVTVVGDYDYNGIAAVDKTMAQILLGTYTALSGILLLNLFIALMSDTFQRVYDNAKANALMQKAIAITAYQASLSHVSKERFLIYLHGQCAPQEVYYDDDDNDEEAVLEKITFQIKHVVDEIKEDLEEQRMTSANTNNNKDKNKENKEIMKILQDGLQRHEKDMDALNKKIDTLTSLVYELIEDRNDNGNEKKNSGENDQVDTVDPLSITYDRLPSIYELKPGMFSPSRSSSPTRSPEKKPT